MTMEFVAFEPGIEVNGQTVLAVVEGFAMFEKIPSDILISEGIGTADAEGIIVAAKDAWFSQEKWLGAFKKISDAVGAGALFGIGMKIPECAVFPPWVTDVH